MSETIKLLLAPFVLYSLLAGGVTFVVVALLERTVRMSPRVRMMLNIAVLAIPFVTYVGFLSHLWRSCVGFATEFYLRLCSVSARYAGLFAPITIVLLVGYSVYRLLLYYSSPHRTWKIAENDVYVERVAQALRNLSLVDSCKVVVRQNTYPFAHVAGLRNPVINVSTGLLDILDDEELLAVISHEHAHIRGKDNYFNLSLVLRELSFFSPFSHLAYQAYLHAREESADMAATTGAPQRRLALASALVKVIKRAEELVALTRMSLLHSGIVGIQSTVKRVEALIGDEPQYDSFSPVLPLALLLALVLLIC